jgi:putative ABC transport system substrate-binding protein
LACHGTPDDDSKYLLEELLDDAARIKAYAAELVQQGTDVFVANGTPAAAALRAQTQTLPIVFVHVSDPVALGFVNSLARPEGNMTGFTFWDLNLPGKWLQVLQEMAPSLKRVAAMFNPDAGIYRENLRMLMRAATLLQLDEVLEAPMHDEIAVSQQCKVLASKRPAGIVVLPDPFSGAHRQAIVSTINRYGIPAEVSRADEVIE